MSRFLSLGFLKATARSGMVYSLLIAIGGFVSVAFGQVGSGAMMGSSGVGPSAMMMGTMDPMGMNQQVGLTNVASGITRPDGSSLIDLQALLYPDAAIVMRCDMNKIDYEGLASFVDEVVEKAGGAVQSDDEYLVDLRKYQVSSAKSSFKQLASSVQSAIVSKFFNKKIDELYFINYQNNQQDSCTIVAASTKGLSDADRKLALETLVDIFKPITIFERFGFIIAVVDHDAQEQVDLDEINERYLAKMDELRHNNGAGSYASAGANNNGRMGMGMGMTLGGASTANFASTSTMPSFNGTSPSALTMNGAQNIVEIPNLLGLPNDLYNEYVKEVQDAKKKSETNGRRAVLPFVRRRFQEPATAENAKILLDALRQADGSFFSFVARDFDSAMEEVASKTQEKSEEDSSFVSNDEQEEDISVSVDCAVEAIKKQDYLKQVKTFTLALSLIGSPRLVLICSFDNEENAKNNAEAAQGALTLAKPIIKDAIEKNALDPDAKVDMSSFVNALFDALRPQVVGSNVAVVLDADVMKTHAADFLPLLGAKEVKTVQQQEAEAIDWDSVNSSKDAITSADEDEDFDDESSQTTNDSNSKKSEDTTSESSSDYDEEDEDY